MAEEDKEYYLIDEQQTRHKSSRNFTGQGSAYYPNGDVYVGTFLAGVSKRIFKVKGLCPSSKFITDKSFFIIL